MTMPMRAIRTAFHRWPRRGSIARSCRRLARCRRGTSSVEFVLVLGPLVLFLFGIIGFGLITYAHNNMVNAAREATRRLSVAEDNVVAANTATNTQAAVACGSTELATLVAAAAPKTAAEQIACDYLTDWAITFNVTASECVPASCVEDPDNRCVTVNISTLASDAFMVDIFDFFSGNLEAEVTMRREAACT